jgi:hypothetical protein
MNNVIVDYYNPFNLILDFTIGVARIVNDITNFVFNTKIDVSLVYYGLTPELFWGPRVYLPSIFAVVVAGSGVLGLIWLYQFGKAVIS